MATIKIKPYKVTEVDANTDSGLQGVHFSAIWRDGSVYSTNTRDQDDPKYYHLWDNLNNLREGKMIQCGHTNAYNCTTAVEYGIGGYRNICPIGGVTGTYTQPSPIKLYFDTKKYNINDDATIYSLTLSFKHRSITADVSNNTTYRGIAPNFSGFDTYKDKKVVTVTFNGQKKTYNKNPPFDSYDKISFTFGKNITGKDLRKNPIVISYGNNLADDAGILYIKDLSLEVDYAGKKAYFTGKQNGNTVYTAQSDDCRTSITFTLEAGWKEGNKKVKPNNQQNKISYSAPKGVNVSFDRKSDGRTVIAELTDSSMIAGKKKVYFTLSTNKKKLEFSFQTKIRQKPNINLISKIEKNVIRGNKKVISLSDGCIGTLDAYDGNIKGLHYSIGLTNNNATSSISESKQDEFYENFLQQLSCGTHKIFFKRGNESFDQMIYKTITVVPTKYDLKFEYENKEVFGEINNVIQNKEENKEIRAIFTGSDRFIDKPIFRITNPTYGKLVHDNDLNKDVPTKDRIMKNYYDWTPEKTGGETTIPLGTYYPGKYILTVGEPGNCDNEIRKIKINITADHKQSFDSIFVRGEDSTAFDYDYLVALEGDTVQEPVYVKDINLGSSYKDIDICCEANKVLRIGENGYLQFSVSNMSDGKKLENIFIELNLLQKDENDNFIGSTDEWVDEAGMFRSLSQDFSLYNEELDEIVSIKNLSEDLDNVDEENVYIHIKELKPDQTLKINLPFNSYMEREAYLQFLLFEEPMSLHSCNGIETFNLVHLHVYDSIMTDISISGDIDILSTSNNYECPLECFETENGIRYRAKNIDTSMVNGEALFVIENDPRLIPYKIRYRMQDYTDLEDYNFNNENKIETSHFFISSQDISKPISCRGIPVKCEIKFPEFPTQTMSGYTDADSSITFFIEIPKAIGQEYTKKSLFENVCKFYCDDIIENVTDSYKVYKPGQIVPLKIYAKKMINYKENKILFKAQITNPGDSDDITVYYRICNLTNNEGQLKTTFKTKTDEGEYNLVPNEITETILLGTNTNISPFIKLEKVVVENKTYNRLYITLKNLIRFNKDVEVSIEENNTDQINKYKYVSHKLEIGDLIQDENKLIWSIPFIKANTQVSGYIDFKAESIGLSELDINIKDFLSDKDINFGVQCECRKRGKQ